MPITLKCACGKTLRVADEHAGKRVKCPVCGAVISAAPPAPPQPMFEVVEDEPAPQPLAAAKPKPRRDEDDDDEGRAYGVQKAAKSPDPPRGKPTFRKRADDDDDDDDDDSTQRRRRLENEAAGFNAKRGAYVVGGILAAAAGIGLVIWGNSSTGRGANRLLVLGILMGVFGLISVVQGITGTMPDDDDE